MTRLDWDREARQERLRRWLRRHPEVLTDLAQPEPTGPDECDRGAQDYVRTIARHVRWQARANAGAAEGVVAELALPPWSIWSCG